MVAAMTKRLSPVPAGPVVPLQVIMTPADLAELRWQDKALCAQVDPEIFFPEKGGSTREAKRVCRPCDVHAECLEYALTHDTPEVRDLGRDVRTRAPDPPEGSMTILIPAAAAVLLALLYLPRLRKDPRPPAAAPEPERAAIVTVLPDPDPEREPFAAGSVLVIGDRP